MSALQAAELEKAAILLTVDATIPTTLPHHVMVNALLAAGREAAIPVSVEVVISPSKEVASWWITRGVLALTLHGEGAAIQRVYKHVQGEAQAHAAEVGVEFSVKLSLVDFEKSVRQLQPTFVRLAPCERMSEMLEYVQVAHVPVIAAMLHSTPKKSRDLVAAGCAGLTLHEELHEAFSAGLRTGLRSRTVTDPVSYTGYGMGAVRELVRHQYQYFHS